MANRFKGDARLIIFIALAVLAVYVPVRLI